MLEEGQKEVEGGGSDAEGKEKIIKGEDEAFPCPTPLAHPDPALGPLCSKSSLLLLGGSCCIYTEGKMEVLFSVSDSVNVVKSTEFHPS